MTDVNDEVKIETLISVGERLRAAREQKKLTIAEVSAQLRLVRSNIEYLENGQWDQLHGRAYARGYFSSYVKFLDLPEQELLSEFSREYNSLVTDEPLLKNKKSGKSKGFPWLWLIFILIIVLIGWFTYPQWQSYLDNYLSAIDKEQIEPQQGSQQEENDDAPVINSVVEPIVDDTDVMSHSSQIESAAELNQSENNEQKDEGTLANIKPAENTLDTEIEIEQNPAEPESSDTIVDHVATINESVAVKSTTSVELQFSEDCWVEITDADGQTLTKKIMLANTSATLEGKPPLTVSLGRAPAVIVTVDGVVFDTTPFTQHGVARFKLGEKK